MEKTHEHLGLAITVTEVPQHMCLKLLNWVVCVYCYLTPIFKVEFNAPRQHKNINEVSLRRSKINCMSM